MATLQTFGDVLALLRGDLELFHYPVLDLAERHGSTAGWLDQFNGEDDRGGAAPGDSTWISG